MTRQIILAKVEPNPQFEHSAVASQAIWMNILKLFKTFFWEVFREKGNNKCDAQLTKKHFRFNND